jgi:REP-associated tyrosine transposase
MAQRELKFRMWGGRRKGAGRKPVGEKARLRHVMRPVLKKRFPVHVTWRMKKEVWQLRTHRCFRALARAFWGGCNRFGFRLVHYSVQGNHMHLLVEAADEKSLARGMNGLGVRVAKGLNRVMGRHGKVLDERYHGHILRTPTEVRNARVYLTRNAERHVGAKGPDPYASRHPLVQPETFLMRLVC